MENGFVGTGELFQSGVLSLIERFLAFCALAAWCRGPLWLSVMKRPQHPDARALGSHGPQRHQSGNG
jgi:hypothetical protein